MINELILTQWYQGRRVILRFLAIIAKKGAFKNALISLPKLDYFLFYSQQ